MLTEPDNIIFNKASIIERTLRRAKEEYNLDKTLTNYTHIDAMILNIERACQATIDLAAHIVSIKHLGIPQNSGEAFKLLSEYKIIPHQLSKDLVSMVGFRNIAIHEYQELNMDILRAVIEDNYKALVNFCLELGVKIII